MLDVDNLDLENLLKIFIVIAMNDAAEEIISKDNNYSAMTNAICNRCEGYSNEFALQSCINCYLDTTKPNDMNFQVFMKTVDNKIQPFTASSMY